ncbi:unnamed protein product [Danaus chrysippus]|uniref:(African queen) hypothetical protein n=1 Tax=Danaus chrysippus TaxID=151541 RepID=A0A8J2QRZ3_9NEOP|nr:unnamed protein product [Danaus chrysippus]
MNVKNLDPLFEYDKNDENSYEYRFYALVYTDIYNDQDYVNLVYKRLYTLIENRNIFYRYRINSKFIQCNNFLKNSKYTWLNYYKLDNFTFVSNVPILVDSFLQRFSNNIYIYNEQNNVNRFTRRIEKPFDKYYAMPDGSVEIENGLIKYETNDPNEFYYLKLIRRAYQPQSRPYESEMVTLLDTSKNMDAIIKTFHKFKFYNLKFSPTGIKSKDKMGNEMYIGFIL